MHLSSVLEPAFRYLAVSILFSIVALGLLVAVIVFLQAVNGAPDGEQSDAGFVVESGLHPQLVPVETGRFESDRGVLPRMNSITIART